MPVANAINAIAVCIASVRKAGTQPARDDLVGPLAGSHLRPPAGPPAGQPAGSPAGPTQVPLASAFPNCMVCRQGFIRDCMRIAG